MTQIEVEVTINILDDTRNEISSHVKRFYGDFTDDQIDEFKKKVKRAIPSSLDNYILNGEDNSNDKN